MAQVIFYLFAAIWAFAGYKKGAAGAGYIFVSAGIASYFSVWLLPFSLRVLAFAPPEYSDYAFMAVLLLSFIILFAVVRCCIEKFLDSYPVRDSDITLSELPAVNGIVGGVFGAASGYVAAAFFAFLLSFIPIQLPIISTAEFAGLADSKLFVYSRIVNGCFEDEWNEKQQAYVKELSEKYRKFVKTEKSASDNAAVESSESEKAAQMQPENENYGQESMPVAAQKIAAKAVNAASANQEIAMREAMQEVVASGRDGISDSAQPEQRHEQTEAEGVTFSLMVPVLNEDGTSSEFTKVTKIGIRLLENGEVPNIIEVDVPHPVLHYRDRVIFRKMRISMKNVTYALVRNLNPRIEVKYVVVVEK